RCGGAKFLRCAFERADEAATGQTATRAVLHRARPAEREGKARAQRLQLAFGVTQRLGEAPGQACAHAVTFVTRPLVFRSQGSEFLVQCQGPGTALTEFAFQL